MTYYNSYGGQPRGRQPNSVVVSQAELQKFQQMAAAISVQLEKEVANGQKLQATLELQAKELRQKTQDLDIRDEALRRQGEHQKQLEAELFMTRAALAEERSKAAADPETASWQERYVRLQAEVDNLRKRWEQRSIAETAENRRLILADMLPLADHLDLALQHQPQTDDAAVRNFVSNIEATRRAFLETLRRYGVERIDPANNLFDPTLHEALGQVVSEHVPADHVAVVTQAGYADGERVLRPARVLVSTGPAAQPTA